MCLNLTRYNNKILPLESEYAKIINVVLSNNETKLMIYFNVTIGYVTFLVMPTLCLLVMIIHLIAIIKAIDLIMVTCGWFSVIISIQTLLVKTINVHI